MKSGDFCLQNGGGGTRHIKKRDLTTKKKSVDFFVDKYGRGMELKQKEKR